MTELIEWSEIKRGRNIIQGEKGVVLGFVGGVDICSIMACHRNGKNNLTMTFMHDVYKNIYSFEAAKAKAKELLDEWLIRADLAKPSEEVKRLEDRIEEVEAENFNLMVDSFDFVPTNTHLKLVKKCKELEQAKPSEWISVDDDMPCKSDDVILWNGSDREIYLCYEREHFEAYYKDITHWALLIEPPDKD